MCVSYLNGPYLSQGHKLIQLNFFQWCFSLLKSNPSEIYFGTKNVVGFWCMSTWLSLHPLLNTTISSTDFKCSFYSYTKVRYIFGSISGLHSVLSLCLFVCLSVSISVSNCFKYHNVKQAYIYPYFIKSILNRQWMLILSNTFSTSMKIIILVFTLDLLI